MRRMTVASKEKFLTALEVDETLRTPRPMAEFFRRHRGDGTAAAEPGSEVPPVE